MKHKKILLTLFSLVSTLIYSQNVIINKEIKKLKNTEEQIKLESSLNNFLKTDIKNNKWINELEFLETAFLLNIIENTENFKTKTNFFKPYLTNIISIDKSSYFIQITYIGIKENTPLLKTSIELIAKKLENNYVFSSPLIKNTKNWKTKTFENFTIYYKDSINTDKIKHYQSLTHFYDTKLGVKPKRTKIYFFDDDLEAQQHFGLPYKLDYNGDGGSSGWSYSDDKGTIYVAGKSIIENFDPHDLWHFRLKQVTPRKEVNHAVDEAIANLYGGCWGYTWREYFEEFKSKIKPNKETDWLKYRKNNTYYETLKPKKHKNPTDFIVNTLFVKEIEKKHGFKGVWKLLNSKEEKKYFNSLKELLNITKENYNRKVWKLIKSEINEN